MKQPNQKNVQTHNIFEENSKQQRSILVAQLEDLNRRRKSKTIRWLFLLLPLFFAVMVTYTHYEVYNQLSIPIIIFAVIITFLLSGFLFIYFNYMLEMRENRIRRAIFELDAVYSQNKIDEDIFKNSIEMSYKYLDQYYSQTREHAQRGFFVTVCVAVFGALLIGTGILSMFFGTTQPAYITCASGVVTELIATVFFYLYNNDTIITGSLFLHIRASCAAVPDCRIWQPGRQSAPQLLQPA